MYRMNAQSRAIEESFLRYGIRYQLVGGTRFYSRREVKDALAYLRILRSDTDSVSFERIINVPARGIGDKTIEVLRAAAAPARAARRGARSRRPSTASSEASRRATRNALADFAVLVRRLRARVGVLALPELLDEALEASGYRAMLADGSEDGEERWANLLELRSVTTRYDDLAPDDALDRLLEETALVADQDSYEGDADAVTLITLHAAKGLEFPVVFIAGPRGGPLPAQPGARRREGARGGAPARLRRDHPGEAAAVPVARLAARDLGDGPGGRPVAVPARDPGRADGRAAARAAPTTATSTSTSCSGRAGRAASGRRSAGGGGPAFRQGSGRPGAPPAGEPFRPARDLAAKREAFADGAPSGSLARPVRAWDDDLGRVPAATGRVRHRPPRPVIPGERQFRDGDRVRHGRWGDGIVVTSKLTRSDEEVTVAFKDAVGRAQDDAGQPRQPGDHRVTDPTDADALGRRRPR